MLVIRDPGHVQAWEGEVGASSRYVFVWPRVSALAAHQ